MQPAMVDGSDNGMKRCILAIVLVITAGIAGACLAAKEPHAPGDPYLRYMYITCYPDECRLSITVRFRDDTPTFHDERTTRLYEPILYSIDERKFESIEVEVSKPGWIPRTKTWKTEVPNDVFIKLEERL